jgi:hypothetical protein
MMNTRYHQIALFKKIKPSFFVSILCLFSFATTAASPTHTEQNDQVLINSIYQRLNTQPALSIPERIEQISAQFLGKPYLLGALGEGPHGDYDQWPLYRTDAFDCQTYVETVLALALANHLPHFQQCLNHLRYKNGFISYTHRNHFTCLDWNRNNQKHILKDITRTIRDRNHHLVIRYARAVIDKPSWYRHQTMDAIRLNHADQKERASRLHSLQQEALHVSKKTSIIAYIPFTALFNSIGQANTYLFDQIPNAAIVEIVRPNWDLSKEIGTHQNISHLGFAFWKKGSLIFREASSVYGRVVDVPLIDYLRDAMKHPTIKGINLQIMRPHPIGTPCLSPPSGFIA